MNVIGYIRVSTQEQTDSGLSLEAQKSKIRDFCKYKGLNLIQIIEDCGVSASIPLRERPGGAELFQKADTSVAAVRLDRLFRDAHDCLGVTKIWNKQGVALHLLDLGIDTSTAMGRAFLTNAATYAELERNLISERTREALVQVKKEGGDLGAEPLGYRRVEDPKSGRKILKKNPEEFKTLETCRKLREQGLTFKQIAQKFNSEGIPTKRGGAWHPSTVRNYCKF